MLNPFSSDLRRTTKKCPIAYTTTICTWRQWDFPLKMTTLDIYIFLFPDDDPEISCVAICFPSCFYLTKKSLCLSVSQFVWTIFNKLISSSEFSEFLLFVATPLSLTQYYYRIHTYILLLYTINTRGEVVVLGCCRGIYFKGRRGSNKIKPALHHLIHTATTGIFL